MTKNFKTDRHHRNLQHIADDIMALAKESETFQRPVSEPGTRPCQCETVPYRRGRCVDRT